MKNSNSQKSFDYRSLVGWISEFSSRPLHDPWPVIILDDQIMRDFDEFFQLCQHTGFNYIVIWGLFVSRNWPVQLEKSIDDERRKQVQSLLDSAHKRGIKILSGLGVYSWGFEEIIQNFPNLSKGNPRAMCASESDSEKWMQKVVDFIFSQFDLDGVQMQSADQGRCNCQECQKWGNVEYHALLNHNTTGYIRSKWDNKTIVINNWGVSFATRDDIPYIQKMSKSVDAIIDYNCSAMAHRKELIKGLDCAYGTLAGVSVGPPQRWERTKWFLPATFTNVPYLKSLYNDGGRGIEQFTVALSNPCGEVTLRFMGKVISDINKSPESALRESIQECFHPVSSSVADGMAEVFQIAENGFFKVAEQNYGHVGLFYIDGGLFPGKEGDVEKYLLKMSKDSLNKYEGEIKKAFKLSEKLGYNVGNPGKWELVTKSLNTVLKDIERIKCQ